MAHQAKQSQRSLVQSSLENQSSRQLSTSHKWTGRPRCLSVHLLFDTCCRDVRPYVVNPIDLQKSVEKWVARLWNVSEESVINAQVKFTTTPFNARSSRFQGVPPATCD